MDYAQRALEAKKAAQQARDEQARAEGAAAQLKKRIKEEFGCKSLKDADALYEQLKKGEAEAAKECEKAWAVFEEAKNAQP